MPRDLEASAYFNQYLIGGWALPPEKYEFVSWDDDIPNIWKNKIHVPNHQPDIVDYGHEIHDN